MTDGQKARWVAHYNSTDEVTYSPSLVDANLVKALKCLEHSSLVWIEAEFRDGSHTQGVITEMDETTEMVTIDANYATDGAEPDEERFNLAEVYRFNIYLVSRRQGSLAHFA